MISLEIKGRDKESGVIVIECYYGVFRSVYTSWIFMIMAAVTFLFAWKILPETKRKSFEEIEKIWYKKLTKKITIPVTEI